MVTDVTWIRKNLIDMLAQFQFINIEKLAWRDGWRTHSFISVIVNLFCIGTPFQTCQKTYTPLLLHWNLVLLKC